MAPNLHPQILEDRRWFGHVGLDHKDRAFGGGPSISFKRLADRAGNPPGVAAASHWARGDCHAKHTAPSQSPKQDLQPRPSIGLAVLGFPQLVVRRFYARMTASAPWHPCTRPTPGRSLASRGFVLVTICNQGKIFIGGCACRVFRHYAFRSQPGTVGNIPILPAQDPIVKGTNRLWPIRSNATLVRSAVMPDPQGGDHGLRQSIPAARMQALVSATDFSVCSSFSKALCRAGCANRGW